MERIGPIAGNFVATVVPASLAMLGVFVANLPVSVFGGLLPAPQLALMPVYFWCLVRPDLMRPFTAFIIGVLEDLFSGGPPGIWGAAFVITYALIDRQRDSFAGLSGAAAILGFGVAMLVCSGTAYAIISVYYWHLQPLAVLLMQIAVTMLLYIPGASFMGWVHRRFVGPLRSDF